MSKYIINENEISYLENDTHRGATLIDYNLGAKNNFSMGISEYFAEEFDSPGIHNIQEGFYVLKGSGYVKIGDKEFKISQGDSFLVPENTLHTIKKDKNIDFLKVLWTHGAI